MSELDIISQKSGPLGESIKNPLNPAFSDFASGGTNKISSTNLNLGLDDDLIAQTIIQNKLDFISGGGGSKLEYPIDVSGNPAYAATVKFQIFEYAMPNEGESQKNHAQTPSDNISVETLKPKVEQQDDQLGIDGPAAAAARLQAQAYSNDAEGSTKNPGFQFFDDAAVTQSFVKTKSEDEADAKNIKASSSSKFKIGFQKKMGSPSIVMYFPLSQTFYDNIAYGSADLQVAGGAIEGAANVGSSVIAEQVKAASANFTKGLIDVISDISGAIQGAAKSDAARLAASKTVGKAPFGIGTAATLLNRMVVNPNVRTLFSGVNVREFAFQFKLISTSPEEGQIIQKIIKTFRKEAYPEAFNMEIGGAQNVALGYNFPNAFKISFHFRGAENKNIPKILPCYLRSVGHTINPTGGGFRNDGKPNEIDLTLTFSEYRALQSQDIEEGY
jgi:hypothetical protein